MLIKIVQSIAGTYIFPKIFNINKVLIHDLDLGSRELKHRIKLNCCKYQVYQFGLNVKKDFPEVETEGRKSFL